MRIDTRKRKKAMIGMKQVSGEEQMLRTMFGVIQNGRKALDSVMLEMGRVVAESIMLMEREELARKRKGLLHLDWGELVADGEAHGESQETASRGPVSGE